MTAMTGSTPTTPHRDRLLLSVNTGCPAGDPAEWLSRMPTLAALARRGSWAQVALPGPTSPEALWSLLRAGAPPGLEPGDGVPPFWEFLRGAGKRVVLEHRDTGAGPVRHLAGSALPSDWQLLLLRLHEPSLETWDRDLKGLSRTAAPQAGLMAVGFHPAGGTPGLLVAGGGFLASAGNLGVIELADLPPTILWLQGVTPPEGMGGHLITELGVLEEGHTEDDMEALFDRLRGLGYLG
jgi:hypothetical protein